MRDADHATQPSSRIHQDLFPKAMAAGFSQFTAEYGLPLSHLDVRYVNGWQFMRSRPANTPERAVKAPPDAVLRWLLRLDPRARRREAQAKRAFHAGLWAKDVDRWERVEGPRWTGRNLALQTEALDELDDSGLADHLRRASENFVEGITLHFALLGPTMPVGELLVTGQDLGLAPTDLARTLEGASPASAAPVELLRRIAAGLAAAGADPTDLDGVRSVSPEAAAALDDYLRLHGWRLLTHDDVFGQTLGEYPDLVLRSIRAVGVTRGSFGDGASVVAELAGRLPEADRDRFGRLVTDARRAYATLDDQSGVLGCWTGGLLRRALLASGARLHASGLLRRPDDVFHLSVAEVVALLQRKDGPSAGDVADRAENWQRAAAADPPPWVGTPPSPPPDPALFPPGMARAARFFGAYLALKMGRPTPGPDLTGNGIGTGTYRGRARVALDPIAALTILEPGDVLVAVATTPAYNTVLPLLGALVTEQGGLLSHPAVVAREFGIPAVVGVSGATSHIRDGAMVEVDAAAGCVRMISDVSAGSPS